MRSTWPEGTSGSRTMHPYPVSALRCLQRPYLIASYSHVLPDPPSQRRTERLLCSQNCRCPRGLRWMSSPGLWSSSGLNPLFLLPQLWKQEASHWWTFPFVFIQTGRVWMEGTVNARPASNHAMLLVIWLHSNVVRDEMFLFKVVLSSILPPPPQRLKLFNKSHRPCSHRESAFCV